MVGYRVANTLSENGSVSRGVCTTDENGYLTDVVERTKIVPQGETIVFIEDDVCTPLEPNTPVSMNMWGFTPEYFQYSEEAFIQFLAQNGQEMKAEFYIPYAIDCIIKEGIGKCELLSTPSRWFGVTFKEDRPGVVAKFQEFADNGIYPTPLYK